MLSIFRLNEIPFEMMGKGQNQRILPYLLAANTVNYGKPFKLNTAEAVAACLYIVGLKGESQAILSSFSYGEEFIRMNHPLLELYSTCITPADVSRTSEEHVSSIVARQQRKEDNAVLKRAANERSGRIGGERFSLLDRRWTHPFTAQNYPYSLQYLYLYVQVTWMIWTCHPWTMTMTMRKA
jgi:hypothetical protein